MRETERRDNNEGRREKKSERKKGK